MNCISTESVPQTWTDHDEQFFGISASLFTPAFCYGASVLLASYDTVADALPESSYADHVARLGSRSDGCEDLEAAARPVTPLTS